METRPNAWGDTWPASTIRRRRWRRARCGLPKRTACRSATSQANLTRRFDCDGELQWIYVAQEHRRSRVASELLRLLAQWFIERAARRICVDVGDDTARPFYRRYGAVERNKHWMVCDDIGVVLQNTTGSQAAASGHSR